jgi:hypothetical protein
MSGDKGWAMGLLHFMGFDTVEQAEQFLARQKRVGEKQFAPNWNQSQVLTWSGKWHISNEPELPGRMAGYRRTLCGVYGYTRDHVPRQNGKLQAIATGQYRAPLCKKCEKAAAAEVFGESIQ